MSDENEELKHRSEVLKVVVANREEQLQFLQSLSLDSPSDAVSVKVEEDKPVMGMLLNDSDVPDNLTSAKNVSVNTLRQKWREFVVSVASLVLEEEVEAKPGAVGRILELVSSISGFFRNISLLNPLCMYQLKLLNMETGLPETPPEEHWVRVVTALQLSDEQKRSINSCYDLYKKALEKIYRDREELSAQLVQAQKLLAAGSASQLDSNSLQLELDVDLILDQLDLNLAREHTVRMMFASFSSRKVLTPLQFAKGAVHCYPYFPDGPSMALALSKVSSPVVGALPAKKQFVVETAQPEVMHSCRLVETSALMDCRSE